MIGNRRGARLRTMLGIPLALTLVVAACGSDADDDADSGTDTSDSTAEPATTDAGDTDEPSSDGDRVEIRWFVGLGTGAEAEQIDRQEEFVAAFNESQDDITLVAEYVDNDLATDQLATQIAAGNAPDIVGPVGREGSNSFAGEWLDIEPLVDAAGFDFSQYDAAQVEAARDADGVMRGLPFATYPSAIFYNTELFDAAGLPYPPTEYGPDGTATYGEGTEYEGPWDWAKLEELAKLMTVDAAGVNAAEDGFDKDNTVQWGYIHQWTEPPQAQGSFWGAGQIEQADGTAKIPQQWVDEWKWYHAAKHESGFVPDQTEIDSDLLAGNAFNSGKVAMANTHQWYTCCLYDGDSNAQTFWNLAIVPEHDGAVVSKLHADNFRMHKDSANPEAAFAVLEYLQQEAALDLLTIYGAMPARNDIRADYFAGLDANFTQGVNWDVIVAGLSFPDNPSHETLMPAHLESLTLLEELEGEISGDPDLDIDARVAEIEAGLNQIWAAS